MDIFVLKTHDWHFGMRKVEVSLDTIHFLGEHMLGCSWEQKRV